MERDEVMTEVNKIVKRTRPGLGPENLNSNNIIFLFHETDIEIRAVAIYGKLLRLITGYNEILNIAKICEKTIPSGIRSGIKIESASGAPITIYEPYIELK